VLLTAQGPATRGGRCRTSGTSDPSRMTTEGSQSVTGSRASSCRVRGIALPSLLSKRFWPHAVHRCARPNGAANAGQGLYAFRVRHAAEQIEPMFGGTEAVSEGGPVQGGARSSCVSPSWPKATRWSCCSLCRRAALLDATHVVAELGAHRSSPG